MARLSIVLLCLSVTLSVFAIQPNADTPHLPWGVYHRYQTGNTSWALNRVTDEDVSNTSVLRTSEGTWHFVHTGDNELRVIGWDTDRMQFGLSTWANCVWIKQDGTSASGLQVPSNSADGGHNTWAIWDSERYMRSDADGQILQSTNNAIPAIGKWFFVCWQMDGANGRSFWINGKQVVVKTGGSGGLEAQYRLWGANQGVQPNYDYEGEMDELMSFAGKALSQEEQMSLIRMTGTPEQLRDVYEFTPY